MDRNQIAHVLHEIGVLLELTGENPFKVRAYANAARIVESLDADIELLARRGRLREIQGIGSALAEKISLLVATGDLPYYQELKRAVPPGLLDMLRIPGLGPKKIYALHQTLGIAGMAELEYACRENRLLSLKGFGHKTQQRLLQGIEHLRTFQGRFLFVEAQACAEALRSFLGASAGAAAVCIAGSVRRCNELVKDIDLVAASDTPELVAQAFCSAPQVARVAASGATKNSVVLDIGIGADLRVVDPGQFPFALHHFTGSREHNTALRRHAKSLGLKMNEYGLFRDGAGLPAADEHELFRLLGLAPIPPELREDMGEIEAARCGGLPELVCARDLQGAFHVHTTFSDGAHSLEDMAAEARALGFTYLGIADHSQSAAYAGGLKPEAVRRQHESVARWNAAHPELRVFHGIESDIHADGSLDYSDDVLALFDFVIASVHSGFSITGAQATARLTAAMRNPRVTMLGHPTGRLLLGREGYAPDMHAVIQAARDRGVIIELNASPQRCDIDWRHLKAAKEAGVCISVNPDAHSRQGLHDVFFGVGLARKGWLERENVFNAWPRSRVEEYLQSRRRMA